MINVRDVGIALNGPGNRDQLRRLERSLAHFQEIGFPLVEIDPTPFSLIVNGELRRPQLADFLSILRGFDLRYSVHGLMRLNLAYDPRHELCRRIMRCQIEICRAMGASRLVYHSGLQALDAVRYRVRSSLLSEEELASGARREVEAFRDLAPVAADAGVVMGMENGDPHQWEYNVLAQFGRPRSELPTHHPRLKVAPIVRQLEAINHPNVGLALDIGHLYIAAHDLEFDYLEAISEAAPWVKHLHVSDNLGRLDQGFDLEQDRWAFGEADVHLLPGWGNIPYHEAFARLPNYEGDLILEIKPGFWDYLGEGLKTVQDILNRVSVADGGEVIAMSTSSTSTS
jgi:sugar phosphate isomerase/epimerase